MTARLVAFGASLAAISVSPAPVSAAAASELTATDGSADLKVTGRGLPRVADLHGAPAPRDEATDTGATVERPRPAQRVGPVTRQFARPWLKGNTHTHTRYSDGDSPPETVVDWYEAHHYDFLFLTDHNALIPDDHLAGLQRGSLAVLQGEEVTTTRAHLTALGAGNVIGPGWWKLSDAFRKAADTAENIRWTVDRILAQGGVATLCHPNLGWGMGAAELLEAGDFGLLEVGNGHPVAWNDGDKDHQSTDEIWDTLLTAGVRVWGVASDDAHVFQQWGPEWSNPGRGWLQVQAESARMGDVLAALQAGEFYASSGLEVATYSATPARILLELASGPARIDLVGPGGIVLDTVQGQRTSFKLDAITREFAGGYIRVRATDAENRRLWMQPFFL